MLCPCLFLATLVLGASQDEQASEDPDPLSPTAPDTGPRYDVRGEVDVGLRGVRVRGSEEQFEEDVNLDPGPVLRSLYIECQLC